MAGRIGAAAPGRIGQAQLFDGHGQSRSFLAGDEMLADDFILVFQHGPQLQIRVDDQSDLPRTWTSLE